jgi:hypothetical protein
MLLFITEQYDVCFSAPVSMISAMSFILTDLPPFMPTITSPISSAE